MEIWNYIRAYNDNSHIEVGDGLISVHTDEKSEVINCNNQQILELSQDEYCINAKNGYFLICNKQSRIYYILNKRKDHVATICNSCLTILEHRDMIVYFDNKLNAVCILDFTGKKLLSINEEFASTFKSAHQISDYIICIEFQPLFEERKFNNEYCSKCIVINISNNEIILQGEYIDGYDKSVVTDASYFDFPVILPNKSWAPYRNDVPKKQLIPTIKFTLIEPEFNNNHEIEYNKHVEFCDFYGNIIKATEFSVISNQYNCFYIVEKEGLNNHDKTYGILDSLLEPFLPCCFPKLIVENNIIKIEEPSWTDWSSKELDIVSKRFLAKRKNGESILLPYLYCSCDKEYLSSENDKLLFAYKYNEAGEYCKGIINTKGDEVLPAIYKTIHQIRNNLYKAVINSSDLYKIQVLFVDGNNVIKRNQYLKIEPSNWSYYCIVRVYDRNSHSHIKLGIIDDKGLEIAAPIYDYVFYPSEDKITYIKNGVAGWMDLSDMSTHEYPKYAVIKPFVNEMAVICIGDIKVQSLSKYTNKTKWNNGYYDPTYHMPSGIDDVYGDICISFTNRLHKEGMIDINGKIIIEPIYEKIIRSKEKENLLIVKLDDKYGAINKQGNIIIPIQYAGYNINPYKDYDEYEGLSCIFWNQENIDFYNSDGELLGTENEKSYEYRHREEEYDDDQDYDYERDTYYALGGNDYDEWRNNGGDLDDMMNSMGL